MPREPAVDAPNPSRGPVIGRVTRVLAAVAPFAGISLLVAAAEYAIEARVVAKVGAISAAASSVVEAPIDRIDPALDGKIVHVAGNLRTATPLADEPFGVKVNAARLFRDVEVYSWVELDEDTGGNASGVVYVPRWVHEPVSSLAFKRPRGHENARVFPYVARTVTANESTLTAAAPVALPTPPSADPAAPALSPPAPVPVPPTATYSVDPQLISNLEAFEPLAYDDSMLQSAPVDVRSKAKIHSGILYLGNDPMHPAVGDVRVAFSQVKLSDVAVVARQFNGGNSPSERRLDPWVAGGTPFFAIAAGHSTAAEMFSHESADDAPVRNWGMRFGLLALLLGAGLMGARKWGKTTSSVALTAGRVTAAALPFAQRFAATTLALLAPSFVAIGSNWGQSRGWLGAIAYGAAIVSGMTASGLTLRGGYLRSKNAE